ncbi:MAG: pilus assembly protein, partial [Betaproteobacteria bacterium]|nr:pilus assembly protein [Betaproteobacteria bacterium]
MKIPCLKNFRRQAGQGMVEFIIVLAAVAVSSVFVYTQFGDVLRSQVAVGALALAGQGSDGQTSAAQYAADQAATGASGGG